MKQGTGIAVGIVAVALAAAGGYGFGTRRTSVQPPVGASPSAAVSANGKTERKLLYYRNPMGLPDTSPTPKKDPMGMDYIAVYSGEPDEERAPANQLKFSTEKIQKLGVRTEAAQARVLDKAVRAAGRVEANERRVFTVAPKFEGYVERLMVNVTGQPVAKGQVLFDAYSPDLVTAQREYVVAAQGVKALTEADNEAKSGMQQLANSSLQRLRNWDISDEQITALAQTGVTQRTMSFRSPVAGIVLEKKAVQGMRFMPGEMLYQVADLSAVWIIADVFEQDIGLVKTGAKATIKINAYPNQNFTGTVTYVYPTLKPETRTVPVRIELANPGLLLKPAMFAQVELASASKAAVLTVPLSSVIDSGTRQIVLVQAAQGRFEPREVVLGERSDTYVHVVRGVKDGEQVVTAANFLIDAESNLKAAVSGFADAASATPAKTISHQAQGTVDGVDLKEGTLSLNHGPVASLKWPAMTMEFKAANPALLKDLKPGAKVAVEFVERAPGEWVITSVKK